MSANKTPQKTVQEIVAVLRNAGVVLQDARGPRRSQRAGMHVTRNLGDEHRGCPIVFPGLVGTWKDGAMEAAYAAAVAAIKAAGLTLVEPHGPQALSFIVVG